PRRRHRRVSRTRPGPRTRWRSRRTRPAGTGGRPAAAWPTRSCHSLRITATPCTFAPLPTKNCVGSHDSFAKSIVTVTRTGVPDAAAAGLLVEDHELPDWVSTPTVT